MNYQIKLHLTFSPYIYRHRELKPHYSGVESSNPKAFVTISPISYLALPYKWDSANHTNIVFDDYDDGL